MHRLYTLMIKDDPMQAQYVQKSMCQFTILKVRKVCSGSDNTV